MRYKSVRNCDIFYAFVFIIIFVLLHTVILEYYAIFKNGGNSFSSNNVGKNGFKEKVLARKSRKKLIKNAILKEPSPTSEEEVKLLELNTNFFQIRNKVILKFVLLRISLFFFCQKYHLQQTVKFTKKTNTTLKDIFHECRKHEISNSKVIDCTFINLMDMRRNTIAQYCQMTPMKQTITPVNYVTLKYRCLKYIQCGNFKIFLSFRFYVKSILENLEDPKLPFLQYKIHSL